MSNVQYVKVYDDGGFEWDSEIVFYPDDMGVLITGITGGPFDLEDATVSRTHQAYLECEKYGEVFATIVFDKGYRKIESIEIRTKRSYIYEDAFGTIVNEYRSR